MALAVRRLLKAVAALCIVLGPGAAAAAEISVVDDLGRAVRLQAPAQRIVTLAPFLAELAFDAGAGAAVVAVSEHSDWPPAARRLPQVGSALNFSLERIAALRPDLVLVWKDSMRPEDVERIAAFGAQVFVANARTLQDVPRLLAAIGRLTGRDTAAVATGYERRLAELRRAYRGKRRLGVFLEIWHKPLTTIAGRHFINEALEICGADNRFADLPGVAPVVPWEELYRRDPEAIVGIGSGTSAEEFAAQWRAHGTLAAVRARRWVHVDPDRLQRPTARTPEGIAELCAALDRLR
jgi:iron complex transport system substrate-binding protein